ncbi:DUF3466 family protein [Aliiglaciecola lipolytica]|uniref:DUF3466 family protein n=1 Tax=Aliiglaciecola lipolytica TaxID=477689 RepID=UPI001C0923B8|nr:DUF3466 family protein [Aliiglaciecola lipolytica]MBU2876311.1 DUF3466 family protein [Aliiglaciecola lipolytica]
MKMNRLASGLTLCALTICSAQAAKYTVVELPLRDKGINSYARAINDRGEVAASIANPFNPPIDVDLINFESEALINTLTDADGASVGNINDDDLLILYSFITSDATTTNIFYPQSNDSTNPFLQQIATVQSYVLENTEVEEKIGFDVIEQDLQGLTKSADTLATGINNFSAIVGFGEAPFQKINYRNENGLNLKYHVQDFLVRGFMDINGVTIEVPPIEDLLGGISVANDINDSFEVAGYGSVDVIDGFDDVVDLCDDKEARGDIPQEYCLRQLRDEYQGRVRSKLANSLGNRDPVDETFLRRAIIWEFSSSGELLNSRELGTILEPAPGDTRFYESRANAINNNGIAVGVSNDFYQDSQTVVINKAAVFDGDDVHGFISDEEYLESTALDINDNDVVVGYANKIITSATRNKFFVYDYRGDVLSFPDDFFESSSSIARGINNNGLVVGEGEVDTDLIGSRRKEAFLYDINTEEFTNINDLLSCDTPYTIVQGIDINDNDEITATAVIYRERTAINGELALDARGNTIFQNMSVAVKLVPIPGGSIDDCHLVKETVERKGGSLYYLLGLALFVFGGRLRQKFKA